MLKFLALVLLPGIAFAKEPAPVEPPSQQQAQSQYQAQESVSSSGLSLSVSDHLQIPYTPPPTAPAIYASHPCALGRSSAKTFPIFGTAKGETTVDESCQFLELIRVTLAVDPCLARKLLQTHPKIAAIDPNPVLCAPPHTVTKEYVDEQVIELKKRQDSIFKQSQQK